MSDPKKENESNLPMIGLGLIRGRARASPSAGTRTRCRPPLRPRQPGETMWVPGDPGGARYDDRRHPCQAPTVPGAPTAEGAVDWSKVRDAAGEQSADCRRSNAPASDVRRRVHTALGDMDAAMPPSRRARTPVPTMNRLCKDLGEQTDCASWSGNRPRGSRRACQEMLAQ